MAVLLATCPPLMSAGYLCRFISKIERWPTAIPRGSDLALNGPDSRSVRPLRLVSIASISSPYIPYR